MAYKRYNLDLTAVIDPSSPKEIVVQGRTIREVFVTKMSPGVTIGLHFAQNGDAIDVDAPVSFQPSGDDEQNRGLYYSNPVALPGTTQTIYVSSGDIGLDRKA